MGRGTLGRLPFVTSSEERVGVFYAREEEKPKEAEQHRGSDPNVMLQVLSAFLRAIEGS